MCSCAYDNIGVETDTDIYSQHGVCTKLRSLVFSNVDMQQRYRNNEMPVFYKM